ncbi:GNAT family N-acetyltransferase [Geodermatophilus sp. SYSU D00815]
MTRTDVRPLTLDDAVALTTGAEEFGRRTGLRLADGYLAFPEALPATVAALRAGMPPEWFSHLLVDPDEELVVGLGGYTGPPEDGVVEIGYSVAPAHRGRGHATRAAAEWVARAERAGVAVVRAHTLAEDNASTAVLARLGFARVAELVDEEDGPLWRWEKELA